MTPAARIAAAIELLSAIDMESRPADLVAAAFWRSRRYMGGGDRRAVSDRIWGCLRRKARLAWWLAEAGLPATARLRVLADLALHDHAPFEEIAALFTGELRAPAKLSGDEAALLRQWKGRDIFHHAMPDWVRGEFPEWLAPRLQAQFGERLLPEMGAMRDEAPVDLRVNLLKTTREGAMAALAADQFHAVPTPLSPVGLRLPARIALTAQRAFQDGLVEVQDEGSQLIALLTDAQPGQSVMDFCAGAGGKTLALAAAMRNKGRLFACDIHSGRSDKAQERLRRAGVHNVTRRVLDAESTQWLKRQAGSFDRVLVDAPCSGSGTWRRNPDAKWRLAEETLSNLLATQIEILDRAARLVKPGGRLIYGTCSLFSEENESQAAGFLARHPDFTLLPVPEIWDSTVGGALPSSNPYLRLTPASNGTDGFFTAIFVRS